MDKSLLNWLIITSSMLISIACTSQTITHSSSTSSINPTSTQSVLTPTTAIIPSPEPLVISTSTPQPTPALKLTPTPTRTPFVTKTPTPTVTPIQPPTTEEIFDPEKVVDYALIWQQQYGKVSLSRNDADFTKVVFPNGDEGSFVSLNGSGGAIFLFRARNGQAELVEHSESMVRWGIREMRNVNNPNPHRVPIEIIPLFKGMKETVFKITGAATAGTGYVSDGVFSILRVTDKGLVTIFSGAEVNSVFRYPYEQGGEGDIKEYEYIDLDGDGWKEITEEGKHCEYQFNKSKNEWEQTECSELPRKVYRFDGNKYIVVE